ncbi:mannosylfructose-phosphate synthase [Geobacter sp. OR-1]|uniref:glycosyltransferase family 4 protein n=1 Tax=Geobacter sp. OR-1 TaxID=1266765 RepID=UPI000541C018|nr:glycosyltransferase family 4 protein [Geobacter sp. OR-1]GAM10721.1 mannosylfructose-phosphate synthase [Geobacter sp. OR-1]
MRLLFFCHDFRAKNLRLMPWRYLLEVSSGLAKSGHEVSLLSVEDERTVGGEIVEGVTVYRLTARELFVPGVFTELTAKAECIVWSATPQAVLYYRCLSRLNRPIILLFTGPFYSLKEVLLAQSQHIPFRQLISHYKNVLVPLRFTSYLINAPFVKAAAVLSERNAGLLIANGALPAKICLAPPGHEQSNDMIAPAAVAEMRCKYTLPHDKNILMYLGSLYRIRGVDFLLESYAVACQRSNDTVLLVLARTDNHEETTALSRRVEELRIADRTIIVPGLLPKKSVHEYLMAADAIVIPFILVPSDMPIGALEAMALGKPVITTNVDGMPEMVRNRGIVVRPGDKEGLASAMNSICRHEEHYAGLQKNCLQYMSDYPTWDMITERFAGVVGSDAQ